MKDNRQYKHLMDKIHDDFIEYETIDEKRDGILMFIEQNKDLLRRKCENVAIYERRVMLLNFLECDNPNDKHINKALRNIGILSEGEILMIIISICAIFGAAFSLHLTNGIHYLKDILLMTFIAFCCTLASVPIYLVICDLKVKFWKS